MTLRKAQANLQMFLKIRLKSLWLAQWIVRGLVPLDFPAAGPPGAPAFAFLTFASHHLAPIGAWIWLLQTQTWLLSPCAQLQGGRSNSRAFNR